MSNFKPPTSQAKVPTKVYTPWVPPVVPRPPWIREPLSQEELLSPSLSKLFSMFQYMRPHGSDAEAAFVKRFIDVIPGVTKDTFGNRFVDVKNEDGNNSRVLWSSHVDTVHKKSGAQKIRCSNNYITLSDKETEATCLGADDTSGVWLMLEMIEAKVPGLYVFHRGEERGGLGSARVASEQVELLKQYRYAIAFDRKGYSSIITSQGIPTASDEFAEELGLSIGLPLFKDDTGSFTDTAHYTHLISECTNVSTGCFNCHSKSEKQDIRYLFQLRDAMVYRFKEADLHYYRDPADVWASKAKGSKVQGKVLKTRSTGNSFIDFDDMIFDENDIAELCRKHPAAVAAFMVNDLGVTFDEVNDYVYMETVRKVF